MSRTRDKDYYEYFYDYDIWIPSSTLYLGSVSDVDGDESGTNYEMTERAVKGLHILDSKADSPITIIMNNLGGDEYHGLAIYDTIKLCKNHITIKARGHAMSMGGIILQAADERQMSANSRLMMHYGSFSFDGNAQDAYRWVDENKKIDKFMEDLFLEKIKEKHPKYTRAKLQEKLNSDYILSAKEALELGLIDKIEGDK